MTIKNFAPIALIGLLFAQYSLACDMPKDIELPDGGEATEMDMRSASDALEQYVIEVKSYQACLAADADRIRANSSTAGISKFTADEDKYVARHNAASDAIAKATTTFNAEIEKFEARR